MKYVRFMSQDELDKYKSGKTLRNLTDWRKKSKVTNSVGFCFFDDTVPPENRMEYLTGVVDLDCVAVFECIDGKMKKSSGRYRDPDKDTYVGLFDFLFNPPKMKKVDEYCRKMYSRESMRLVREGKVKDAFGRVIQWKNA